jgi:ADP-heptose:LPS heptosyltransferase
LAWTLDGIALRSILVTRLRYLGDVVMSTVVLEALRKGDPDLHLAYLAEEAHGQVLAGHPGLDGLHLLRSKRRGRDARARQSSRARGPGSSVQGSGTLSLLNRLRRQSFDLTVDLFFTPVAPGCSGWPAFPGVSEAPRARDGWLYTHTVIRREVAAGHAGFNAVAPGGLGEHLCRLAPLVHEPSGLGFLDWLVENYSAGELKPRLVPPHLDGTPSGAEAGIWPVPGKPYLILAPGATWPTKEWPAEHWRELVRSLLQDRDEDLYILVPPGSSPWPGRLEGAIPSGRGGLLPPLPLKDVMGLLAGARLLVSVDGGIMHTSVGLGTPTLALFGPTRTDVWFPYRGMGPFQVLCTSPACHPCGLHECGDFICLPDLSPEEVAGAARGLLPA